MIVHEDDQRIVQLTNNGNTVMLTNKQSGVVGVMEIDGPNVLFGSHAHMEIVHIQGNALVSCWEDEDHWPGAEELAGNEDELEEDEVEAA